MMKREDGSTAVFRPLVGTGHSGEEKSRVLYGVARANDIGAGRNPRTTLRDLHNLVQAIATDP
jgi:hypothetical protein